MLAKFNYHYSALFKSRVLTRSVERHGPWHCKTGPWPCKLDHNGVKLELSKTLNIGKLQHGAFIIRAVYRHLVGDTIRITIQGHDTIRIPIQCTLWGKLQNWLQYVRNVKIAQGWVAKMNWKVFIWSILAPRLPAFWQFKSYLNIKMCIGPGIDYIGH